MKTLLIQAGFFVTVFLGGSSSNSQWHTQERQEGKSGREDKKEGCPRLTVAGGICGVSCGPAEGLVSQRDVSQNRVKRRKGSSTGRPPRGQTEGGDLKPLKESGEGRAWYSLGP